MLAADRRGQLGDVFDLRPHRIPRIVLAQPLEHGGRRQLEVSGPSVRRTVAWGRSADTRMAPTRSTHNRIRPPRRGSVCTGAQVGVPATARPHPRRPYQHPRNGTQRRKMLPPTGIQILGGTCRNQHRRRPPRVPTDCGVAAGSIPGELTGRSARVTAPRQRAGRASVPGPAVLLTASVVQPLWRRFRCAAYCSTAFLSKIQELPAVRRASKLAAILLTYCEKTSRMVAASAVEIHCVSTSEREVSRAKRPVAVSSSRCRRCCTSRAGGSRPGVGREREPGAAQRRADVQRFSRPCHTRRPIPCGDHNAKKLQIAACVACAHKRETVSNRPYRRR
jgi:hypothetical protein